MPHALALTFDDAYVDEWVACLPLFEKYAARVTFFVSHFLRLSISTIHGLHQLRSAGHEIGFHSVNHKNAVKMSAEIGLERYEAEEVFPGIAAMAHLGLSPTSFAYPFNARSDALDSRLSRQFKILRAHAPTIADALHPPRGNRLLLARSCDLQHGEKVIRSSDEALTCLKHAKESGKVLGLYAHGVSDMPVNHLNLTRRGLEIILAAAREYGFEFVTASDLA